MAGHSKVFTLSFLFIVIIAGTLPAAIYYKFPFNLIKTLNFTANSLEATDSKKPNIILIVTDDQPYDMLKALPFLNSKPGGYWVEFDKSFVNTSWCCPARATLLSGQYSHNTGVETNKDGGLFDESTSLATWLDTAGYRTGLVGKYLNLYPFNRGNYIPAGWDYWVAYSNGQPYYNYKLVENGILYKYGSSPADYSTDVLKEKALTFINNTSSDPFFLFFAPVAPHYPRTPAPRHIDIPVTITPNPQNYNEVDVTDKPKWVQRFRLTSLEHSEIIAERTNGYRMLLSVDEAIQEIYDAVEAKGKLANTVFIFTSDNGYSFGSHRYYLQDDGKKCGYEECLRSPLLIRYPIATQSAYISNLVSNVDIAPTIAEIAGATPTLKADGVSLVPLLNHTSGNWRDSILFRWKGGSGPIPGHWGIRTDTHKYIELDTGEKELYDLVSDPYELVNQANEPTSLLLQEGLKAKLDVLKAE